MLTKNHLFLHAGIASEPPTIASLSGTGVLPLMMFLRFMGRPKDVRFMVYECLLERRIKPMTYPDQGIAYEVITTDPAIAQMSHQLRDKVQVATR
jgi:hypothetical protein